MNEGQNDTIDLRAILRKILKKWWLFGITTTIAVACAVWYVKTTPKTYEVTAVMLMSDTKRDGFGRGEEFLKGTSYLSTSGGLEDEISVLMSFTNILNTVQQLDFGISYYEEKRFQERELYEYRPFTIRLDTGVQVSGVKVYVVPDFDRGTYRVKAEGDYVTLFNAGLQKPVDGFLKNFSVDKTVAMGKPFRSKNLNFSIEFGKESSLLQDAKYFFAASSNVDVAAYYRAKTSTTPLSEESNIIIIATTGQNTKKEKDFINTLMHTYIKGEQERHNEKGKKIIAFIDNQLDRSSESLHTAEGNLQEVQSSAGSLVGSASDRSAAVFNDLSRLKDDQAAATSKLEYLGELISHMGTDNGGTPATVSASSIDSPSLNSLIDQYNQGVNELATKRLVERQQSAPTIALARKVQTQRNQIIQSAQDARRAAKLELEQISQRVSQLSYMLNQLPQSSRKMSIATRKYDLSASINTYLMEKRYEAEIAVNSDQVDKYIVDPARVSLGGAVSPSKSTALGLALMLGLVLPLAIILVLDFFNDRIMDLEELKRLSPIPVLSTLPTSKRQRINQDADRSVLAEGFRTARINLQYLNLDTDRQVVGITSSTSGEGKTFCSVNLATVMALGNQRTLLMDADMRKPKVHERLGMEVGEGLSSFLIGAASVDQIIRKTDIPGLDVITAGPIPPNPLELFENPRFTELIVQLRNRYDQLVIDASPMGVVSEFKVLLRHLDITLYVVRQGYTRRHMLRPVNELYRTGKLKHIDLLLNDVKAAEGYGYVYEPN